MIPYIGDLTVEKLHVQAPTEVVFLCGGPWSNNSDDPIRSMRHAFLNVAEHKALRNRELVRAEDVTKLSTFSAHYDELLQFENDLAQIVELILLFCESEGSFAELGSFVMLDEIATRVLVVIRDHHWQDDSFIKLGPLQFLINRTGEYSVFVIEDAVMGMKTDNIAEINLNDFAKAIDEPLSKRLERVREPSTFDPNKSGHLIKLIVGIIQEYGALTFEEVSEILTKLGLSIDERQIGAYLLCAESVGWTTKKNKGFKQYIVATGGDDAALFHSPDNAEIKDRKRRRVLIREFWEEKEPARMRAIKEQIGGEL